MYEYITVCEQAARAGGTVLLDWQGRFNVREKAPADLVTEADLASQETIRQMLLSAFPDHGFLGEEDTDTSDALEKTSPTGDQRPEFRWIVDPLDGTTNYVHRLNGFCVSVALERKGNIIAATVFDPVSGECFTAEAGKGAFLNGQPIRTSNISQIGEALVAVSFSPKVRRSSPDVAAFVQVLEVAQAIRRLGSAALNLSYLAAGRLDAYWASSVKTWDVAAGVLLLKEAGGTITAIDGSPLDLDRPAFAAAATQTLHGRLIAELNRTAP